jgi:hypothetical protein
MRYGLEVQIGQWSVNLAYQGDGVAYKPGNKGQIAMSKESNVAKQQTQSK